MLSIALGLGIAATGLNVALAAVPAHSADRAPANYVDSVFPRGLAHAPSEDGCVTGVKRCVWDARHQGNGRGKSLILTEYRDTYLAQPIRHHRAHRLQAHWCKRPSVNCGY